MKEGIFDTDMAITFAIKVIKDNYGINIKRKEFEFVGLTANGNNIFTYTLLVRKFTFVIHIEINKTNCSFRAQMEYPKIEYIFNTIPQ